MRVAIPGRGVLQGHSEYHEETTAPTCHVFSRISYALPPIGDLRWRRPQPLPKNFTYGSESAPGQHTGPCVECPQTFKWGRNLKAVSHESCLQLKVWIPLGNAPREGWPVLFYIHGGFLQFGSNNRDNPSSLLSDTEAGCVIVSPNYRLGVLGFLSSRDVCDGQANFGFWDQRAALEWTSKHIAFFGGNPKNITVAGYSAGAYSAFYQLAYDIRLDKNQQLVRRVIMWSNGCGVEPKQFSETQQQFDELVAELGIHRCLSSSEKLKILRTKTPRELIHATETMKQKFFRPVLDNAFISQDLFPSIYSGAFGRRLKELGIQIMAGDLTQEFHVYKGTYPPASYRELVDRLSWDYPRQIAVAVCSPYKQNTSRSSSEWASIFGDIYTALQIHSSLRGLLRSISQELPLSSIHRYRIDWRTKSVDKKVPRKLGPTHGTDLSIWFFGNGSELTAAEKTLLRDWWSPVATFLKGGKVDWRTRSLTDVRYLTAQGEIKIIKDEIWDEKLPLWDTTRQVTLSRQTYHRSKL